MKSPPKDLRDVVYTLSHDLKSPLMSLASFIHILKEDKRLEEKEKEHIFNRLFANIHLMNDLIQNFLDYFRLSQLKKEDLKIQPINEKDLTSMVQSQWNQIIKHRKNQDMHLELNLHEEFEQMSCDHGWLEKLFNVLIDNALKYAAFNQGKVVLSSEQDKKGICFRLENNGTSFDAQEQKKVFELLFRGQNQPGNIQGSGLGLTIAKDIVEKHGGDIWLEKPKIIKEAGTAVCFNLPH